MVVSVELNWGGSEQHENGWSSHGRRWPARWLQRVIFFPLVLANGLLFLIPLPPKFYFAARLAHLAYLTAGKAIPIGTRGHHGYHRYPPLLKIRSYKKLCEITLELGRVGKRSEGGGARGCK
jgi:hypothetical protein